MLTLIFNSVLQYAVIGFICAAFIDLSIRTSKSSEPFTLVEILGTVLAWPIVLTGLLRSLFQDFFN